MRTKHLIKHTSKEYGISRKQAVKVVSRFRKKGFGNKKIYYTFGGLRIEMQKTFKRFNDALNRLGLAFKQASATASDLAKADAWSGVSNG